jgi:adenylate cyclase
MLALTYVTSYVQSVDKDYRSQWALRRALGLARKAIALDPLLPHAHNAHGNALTFLGRIEAAIQAHEKAISLNRNIIDWRYGGTLLRGGYRERAIEVLERYMLLDPFYHPAAAGLLGLAQFQEREYERSLPLLRECVQGLPNHRMSHAWLAATYVKLGRMKDARSEALEVLRIDPGYRVSMARREPDTLFAAAPDADHYFIALRKAGVPD